MSNEKSWLADCLTPEQAKQYIGQEMEFRDWPTDGGWSKEKLVHLVDTDHPFVDELGSHWQFCRLPRQPKVTRIRFNAETAPFPLALRRKDWDKGEYWLFDVSTGHVSSCATDQAGDAIETISWEELADEDSEWEQRDQSPACDIVEETER